jgi:UDP-N-acetylglucosamine acyltransferase
MKRDEVFIHPSASVHSQAKLDVGVSVGPFSSISEDVFIGKNTKIEANVFITGKTEIGADCHFFSFSSIGTEPQDVTYLGEKTCVKIGDRNIFREFMMINRGTVKGGEKTLIGNDNYFMAYSHIAHDCSVGNETIFLHGATLAGHVTVDDYATVGAFSGIHQFCKVGKYAFIGGYSVITQDILPFCRVVGSRPALVYGVNIIGLRRKEFSNKRIKALKDMFKIIFYSDFNTTQAIEEIEKKFQPSEDKDEILEFIQSSQRGFIKKTAEKWDIESE